MNKSFLCLIFSLCIFNEVKATVVDSVESEKEVLENSITKLNFFYDFNKVVLTPKQAFGRLLSQLSAQYAPVSYLRESLPFIRSVKFIKLDSNIFGIYNRATKIMTLGLDFIDLKTNLVKDLSLLTTDQLASVYHEFWHAYRDSIASKSRRNEVLYLQWSRASRNLYRSKGSLIHDESYGLYAEEVVRNYLNFYRIFSKKSFDVRVRLRENTKLENIYLNSFSFPVFGYYRNWRGQFITSKVNLPLRDRLNIDQNLLKNLIPRNYLEAFIETKFSHFYRY